MNGKQLKNSILQWAIQGKLVPQDPTEEPASALLERIRAEKARLVKEGKIKKDKNESIIFRGDDNSYYEKFQDGKVVCIDEEIPFEIPQGWEWSRIGNIFLHASGKQQSGGGSLKGSPQKYITTSNLYWGRFVLDTVKVMNFTDEEIRTCSATKGDLLVCEGGAGYGRSAIWDKDYDICLQNHIHRLRPCNPGICEYVYFFIYLQKESNQLSSVGTAMPGLSANKLKGLLIPMPPLEEQKRITSKLSIVLSIVERYGRCQESVDSLNEKMRDRIKQSILQEAIQGKLVCQNSDEGTASALLDSIYEEKKKFFPKESISTIFRGDDNKYYEKTGKAVVDISGSIPFDIPDFWVWCRLGTLFQHNTGKALNRAEQRGKQLTYITTSNLYWDKFELDDLRSMYFSQDEIEKCTVIKGDLLVCEGGDIGRAAIWPYDEPIRIQNHIHKLRPYSALCSRFFYYAIAHFKNTGMIGGKGIGIQGLSAGALHQLLLPVPPLAEQARIVDFLDKSLASIMSR